MQKEKKAGLQNTTKLEAELVLDCLDFEILVISKDFEIIFANKAFLKRVGMSADEVVGNHCYKVSHHKDNICQPPFDPCPIEKVMRTGVPAVETHTHIAKDGEKFLVNVTAARINKDGEEDGFLHIALPVEKDKENNMEEALEKTMDVLNAVVAYQERVREINQKNKQLETAKNDLEFKIAELESVNNVTINRELKMIELKKKIDELEQNCKNE